MAEPEVRSLDTPNRAFEETSITKILRSQLTSPEVTYNSYSGCDIIAALLLPGDVPVVLGEVATISYSSHRENNPVRFLGRVNPAGFVKGPRLIAGSMIFTVFDFYAFYRLASMRNAIKGGLHPVADMLPPFDIILTFSNEFGSFSKMKIYGITIIDEGGTMSVDDLITESSFSFMARAIEPLTPISMNATGSLRPSATTTIIGLA